MGLEFVTRKFNRFTTAWITHVCAFQDFASMFSICILIAIFVLPHFSLSMLSILRFYVWRLESIYVSLFSMHLCCCSLWVKSLLKAICQEKFTAICCHGFFIVFISLLCFVRSKCCMFSDYVDSADILHIVLFILKWCLYLYIWMFTAWLHF